MFSAFFSFIAAHILYLALHLETGSFPRPMSAKQEQDAFRQFSQGDRKARDEIVCRNLRLVAHIAKKYYSATEDQDDLVSIGTIGLIKAVDSFDAQKGARFATYAARCIENELLMHFRSAKKTPEALSLSDPIDGDSEGGLTLNDVMADSVLLDELYDVKEETNSLYAALRDLPEREQRVLILRYGLNGKAPLTQQQVAQMMGISRSYISRIEKKSVESIREKMKTEHGDKSEKTEKYHLASKRQL